MKKLALLFCLSLMSVGCAYPQFKATKDYAWTFDGSDPLPVDVTSYNGEIEIVGSDNPEIEVKAMVTTRGFTQAQADAELEKQVPTSTVLDGKLVATAPKSSGFSTASVRFALRVPHKTKATIDTSNGRIVVKDLQSEVECETSNGSINVEGLTGKLRAKTSNGSIKIYDTVAEVSAKTSNGAITANLVPVGTENELRTSNGRVEVGLPMDMMVDIEASTSNGSVTCNLPLDADARKKKTSLLGTTVGKSGEAGKTKLLVRTSNGSVEFREMKDVQVSEEITTTEAEIVTPGQIEL